MENKAELKKMLQKRNFYTIKDSGKVYLYALLLPLAVGLIFSYISIAIAQNMGVVFDENANVIAELFNNYFWFSIPYMLISQLVFVCLYLAYHKANRIEYSASRVEFKKTNVWSALLSALTGIVCVLGFLLLIEVCFGKMFEVWGLEPNTLGLPLDTIGWYFANLLILGVVPAICEELLFRGVIFQGIKEKFSGVVSILISGLLFALIHQSVQQFIYPFILGCLLSFVFEKTNNLIYPILIHMFNNFATITLSYLVNVGVVSLNFAVTWWVVLIAIAIAAVAVLILWLIYNFYLKKKDKIEFEKKGELVQSPSINVGKMPLLLVIGIILSLIMIVINAIG